MSSKTGTFVSAGAAALVLILLLAAALYLLLPQRLAAGFAEAIERETGLGLAVNGPSSLSFADGLAANFAGVRIASPGMAGGLQIEAKRLSFPIGPANLAGKLQQLPTISVTDAVITLALGAPLQPTQTGVGKGSLKEQAPTPAALRIHVAGSTFALTDSRSGFSALLRDANGYLDRAPTGQLRLHLSGLFNGAHSTIHLEADDAGRIAAGGSPADIVLSSDKGELQFSGRLAWADELALDGRLFAASRNTAGFMAWLGLPSALAPATAFELESAFSSSGVGTRLAALTLTHDATTVTGQISLGRQQRALAIDGTLQTNELRLPAFWRKPGAREDWSSAALSWLPLPEIVGRLEVSATTLNLQKWVLRDAKALLEFKGRTARLTATANDGAAELSLTAAGTDVPGIGFRMKLNEISAAETLPPLAGYTWLDGLMDLDIDVSAKGANTASLVSTLMGKLSMKLRNGRVSGYSLKDLLADAGKGWRSAPGDATNGLTVEITGNIADGIFTLQPARLKADDLDVGLAGEIDLLRQAVDLRLEAKSDGDIPAKPAVSGSWYDPDFGAVTAQSGEQPVPAPSAN